MCTSSVGRPIVFPSTPAPGLQRNAVVRRIEVRSPSITTCLHESTSIPIRSALHHYILERDVLAIHRMDRPHAGLLRIAVLHVDVLAIHELQQRRQTDARGPLQPALNLGASHNLAWPHNADVVRIRRVDEARCSPSSSALPAHLRIRIVGHIRRPVQGCAVLNPQHHVAAQRQRAPSNSHPRAPPPRRRQAKNTRSIASCSETVSLVLPIACSAEILYVDHDLRFAGADSRLVHRSSTRCRLFRVLRLSQRGVALPASGTANEPCAAFFKKSLRSRKALSVISCLSSNRYCTMTSVIPSTAIWRSDPFRRIFIERQRRRLAHQGTCLQMQEEHPSLLHHAVGTVPQN